MNHARHTLVDITLQGRKRLFAEIVGRGMEAPLIGQMLLPEKFPMLDAGYMGVSRGRAPVPGIVCRGYGNTPEGHLSVGLVSWECAASGRLRIPAQIALNEVKAAQDPVEVLAAGVHDGKLSSRTPCLRALERLWNVSGDWGMSPGVWGSAAMELHTGYLYTHPGSDLDFFLRPKSGVSARMLTRCLDAVLQSEQNFQVRVDAELSVPGGYGVSLKELMVPNGTSVLGKGLHDIVLLRKGEVLRRLAAT